MRRRRPATLPLVPLLTLLLGAFALLSARPATADQCEPREAVSFDLPVSGAAVPPNIRFRVLVYAGCSAIPPGPPSQFRLLDARGRSMPLRRVDWAGYREYAPQRPLPPGRYSFQHRHAADQTHYAPWTQKTRVRVAGAADHNAPRLGGRLILSARPVWGSNFLSPCQAQPGWELAFKATFPRAHDHGPGASSHDDLIYFLRRKPLGRGAWTIHHTFRPHTTGRGASHGWRQEREWGQRFEYQLGARDRAGNSALSARPVTLELPRRPQKRGWRGGRR